MRASWLSLRTGTCVALVNCCPSAGQNPESSGYSLPHTGQAFMGDPPIASVPTPRTPSASTWLAVSRRAFRGGSARFLVVQDAIAARALDHLLCLHDLLKQHRRQRDVALGARASNRRRNR